MVFQDIWRICKEVEFAHLCRSGLEADYASNIMTTLGYSEEELDQMKIRATLRQDDLVDDLKLDLEKASEIIRSSKECSHE